MKRKEAEKLLAAMIFDDLDEASKSELLSYLQTDDELRERLADMRMAVKVTSDTLQHGPDPVLSKPRLKRLAKLAAHRSTRPAILTVRRVAVAAAILVVVAASSFVVFSVNRIGKPLPSFSEESLALSEGTIGRSTVYGVLAEESSEDKPRSAGPTSYSRRSPEEYGEISHDDRSVAKDYLNGMVIEQTRGRSSELSLSAEPRAVDMWSYNSDSTAKTLSGRQSFARGAGGSAGMGGMGMMGGMGGYGGGLGGDRVEMYDGHVAGGFMEGEGDGDGDGVLSFGDRHSVAGTLSVPDLVAVDEQSSRLRTKPESASSAPPAIPLSGPAGGPVLTDRPENTIPQIVVMDTEDDPRSGLRRKHATQNVNGAVDEKLNEELGLNDRRLGRRMARSSVSAMNRTVVDYNWQGSITEAKVPLRDSPEVALSNSSTNRVRELGPGRGETTPQDGGELRIKLDAVASRNERAGQETHERAPLLGDVPAVGSLFRREAQEESLSLQDMGQVAKSLEEAEPQPKEKSERAMVWSRGEPGPQANERQSVDRANMLAEEDGIDLPPSSRFQLVPVNPWVMAERDPLSTFALDVDTASYTLCRRYIRGGFLPPAGAVRMEEFVNYFNYHYPQRSNPTFVVHAKAAPSPFGGDDRNLTLLKIGAKARTIGRDQRKVAHLIFVVDTSASMGQADRLPLVQGALRSLVGALSQVDRISLITCADEARLHLEATSARERDTVRQTIGALQPAGATNLLAGLKLGYAVARRCFAPKQINHVVLCSDGVANVGQTEVEAILREVAADRRQGIAITCVGVGYGSYNDAFLEALANRGDGRYMFLDSGQAQQAFVEQFAATLQIVARDARIQVEFNPQRVRRYRLVGYENRDIEDQRFRDDAIDAGEVGSGQCATALYELELVGQRLGDRPEDLGTVFVRYRHAETGQMEEISSRVASAVVQRREVENDPRFFLAAGAARFAEWLRQSEHAQSSNLTDVLHVVEQVSLALPLDRDVRELVELIRQAEHLPRSP